MLLRFDRKTVSLSIFLLAVLQLANVATKGQRSNLWGDLDSGPYPVGYKTVFTYDLARPFIRRDAKGKDLPRVKRGRQMQIGVWYPAVESGSKAVMRFEEYVFLAAQELDFSAPTLKRRKQAVADYIKVPLSHGASAEKLQVLMHMRTKALKNAVPASGSFPLVVYAHVPPSGNSILCEYLASYGFVVAAISWKGTFEYDLDVGLTGVETQIKDIEFVIGLLRANRQSNTDKIALIGMSFGAISALGLLARNPELDALISLDGGIGSVFGANVAQRTVYYSLSKITSPLMHLHGPNVPGTDLTYLYSLKYTERYLVGFPGMRHQDFTNIGMLEHLVPNIQGKPPGDTKTGFEWVCRYTLQFLKAFLHADNESLAFLKNPPDRNGVPRGLLKIEARAKLRPPPTAEQLQAMIEQRGIESILTLYKELRRSDPRPLPQQTFSEIGIWLAQKSDWKSAKEIVDLRLESYPDSAWSNYAAAETYRRLGEKERAQQLYEKALLLLASDFDPELDFSRRRAIHEGARRNLEASNTP